MSKKSYKWMFLGFCLPLMLWAQVDNQTAIQALDRQISVLKSELHQQRLEELDEETKGQDYWIANWDQYGEELKTIQKEKKNSQHLEKQIEFLEARKAHLLQQNEIK